MAFPSVPESSSYLPGILGIEVDDPRDDSWRGSFMKQLYLASKLSHVGVDVDELAYPLHQPIARSCLARGPGLFARCYPVLLL
jgi:hypothetical protein